MAGRQDVALYRVLMNINQCGCRPYEWLGLDGDRCIRVIPRQKLSHIYKYTRLIHVFPPKKGNLSQRYSHMKHDSNNVGCAVYVNSLILNVRVIFLKLTQIPLSSPGPF